MALNFRAKCRQAEETLQNNWVHNMVKNIVKTEPTLPGAKNNITTEPNNVNKTTKEYPLEGITIKKVKVEYDTETKMENVIKPENIADIKPNIQIISKKVLKDDKHLQKELPIEWEKDIPNRDKNLFILERNISTARKDISSRHPKVSTISLNLNLK